MLLFRPDLEDDKLQAAVEKVTRAIVNAGGALTKVSPWGKRRLAYDIKHFREASYFLIHFDIAPSEVRGIERGILITEEILRHLVTVLEEKALGRADDDILIPDEEIPGEIDGAEETVVDELGDAVGDEDEVAAEA
jgi:small subunit ribosomal protein S6